MEHPYKYIGCFIEPEEFAKILARIPEKRLYRIIEHPHITFAYRPADADESLFHEKINIRVVGYGNNTENEGVKVELSMDHPRLQKMAESIAVPHITISVSKDGRSVDTGALSFREIPPFEITGRFGGYTWQGTVIV